MYYTLVIISIKSARIKGPHSPLPLSPISIVFSTVGVGLIKLNIVRTQTSLAEVHFGTSYVTCAPPPPPIPSSLLLQVYFVNFRAVDTYCKASSVVGIPHLNPFIVPPTPLAPCGQDTLVYQFGKNRFCCCHFFSIVYISPPPSSRRPLCDNLLMHFRHISRSSSPSANLCATCLYLSTRTYFSCHSPTQLT